MPTHHFLPGTEEDLKRTLFDVNRKMQEEEVKTKASSLGLPYVDLFNFPIDFNVFGLLTEEEARAAEALFFTKNKTICALPP